MADWNVYILWSLKSPRTYTGISENIDRRCQQHNAGKVSSTKKYMPWKIIYSECAGAHGNALKREKYYKSSDGRRKLKLLLESLKEEKKL